jgi:hypothetical protein
MGLRVLSIDGVCRRVSSCLAHGRVSKPKREQEGTSGAMGERGPEQQLELECIGSLQLVVVTPRELSPSHN